jgi:hypothetical protein
MWYLGQYSVVRKAHGSIFRGQKQSMLHTGGWTRRSTSCRHGDLIEVDYNENTQGSTNSWDRLDRLRTMTSKPFGSGAPSLPVAFGYQYTASNQRTRVNREDGACISMTNWGR